MFFRRSVQIFLVLALAGLIYAIGMPGCSPTGFVGVSDYTGCAFMPEGSECNEERLDVSDYIDPTGEGGSDRTRGRDRADGRADGESDRGDRDGYSGQDGDYPEGAGEDGYYDSERGEGEYYEEDRPSQPATERIKISYNLALGNVEILFVIDNSSSMAKEHRSLAKQFRNFLNRIKNIKYRIAVITTDISSSPENPVRNASYQDGRFIPIGGKLFLENENLGGKPSQKIVEDFKSAIVRPETQQCDTSNFPQRRASGNRFDQLYEGSSTSPTPQACPSHDERGIYALNRAINNPQHQSFFDPLDHLMIIILSDEDNRSSKEYIQQPGNEIYAYENEDYPEVLAQNFYNHFGPLKSFSVHSIIIPPGDSSCLNEQNRDSHGGFGTGRGYYGEEYARLSQARRRDQEITKYGNLIKGSVISICDRNYGSQMQRVDLSTQKIRVPLSCEDPRSVKLFANNRKIRFQQKIEGRTLIMEPRELRLDARLKVEIVCEVPVESTEAGTTGTF